MEWVNSKATLTAAWNKYKYIFLVILLGICLMMMPEKEKTEDMPAQDSAKTESNDLEQKLEEILPKIEGAGKVKVLLTQAIGEETIYRSDTDTSLADTSSDKRETTVIITDSSREESALVSKIIPPVYQGAIIVCQGADRAAVRLAIVEAVSKATGLSSNQISVLKMK